MSVERGKGERREFVKEIGGFHEIMHGEPAAHDLFEILTTYEKPFKLVSSLEDDEDFSPIVLGYRYGSFKGRENYVWLSNNWSANDSKKGPGKDTINGLFMVDRENKRVLCDPLGFMPDRDSYRSLGGEEFAYNGTLGGILEVFQDKDYPFLQISLLDRLSTSIVKENPDTFLSVGRAVQTAKDVFERETGKDSMQAYQIHGRRTLEQIRKKDFLPESLLNFENMRGYLEELKKGWLPSEHLQ